MHQLMIKREKGEATAAELAFGSGFFFLVARQWNSLIQSDALMPYRLSATYSKRELKFCTSAVLTFGDIGPIKILQVENSFLIFLLFHE